MKTNLKITGMTAIAMLSMLSCKPKKVAQTTPGVTETVPAVATEACNNTTYTYASDVKSIIDNNCAKTCHSAENHTRGINLSTHESLKEEAMKPRFLKAVRHEGFVAPMPRKAPKLSDSTLNILSCWIENGCK